VLRALQVVFDHRRKRFSFYCIYRLLYFSTLGS